jgi:hypothetical protein
MASRSPPLAGRNSAAEVAPSTRIVSGSTVSAIVSVEASETSEALRRLRSGGGRGRPRAPPPPPLLPVAQAPGEDADGDGDGEEGEQLHPVLVSGDLERVVGRHEEEVPGEKAENSGQQGRPDSSRCGDEHDDEEVEEAPLALGDVTPSGEEDRRREDDRRERRPVGMPRGGSLQAGEPPAGLRFLRHGRTWGGVRVVAHLPVTSGIVALCSGSGEGPAGAKRPLFSEAHWIGAERFSAAFAKP